MSRRKEETSDTKVSGLSTWKGGIAMNYRWKQLGGTVWGRSDVERP